MSVMAFSRNIVDGKPIRVFQVWRLCFWVGCNYADMPCMQNKWNNTKCIIPAIKRTIRMVITDGAHAQQHEQQPLGACLKGACSPEKLTRSGYIVFLTAVASPNGW